MDDVPYFMTVPNEAPFTTPSHNANIVMRVVLGIVAILSCMVPLRLLYRNGEFAAVAFIVTVQIKNFLNISYALIWRTEDMETWWPGYGFCDVDPYITNALNGLFSTTLLAIMRNLAHQVGLLRANPLTVKERRRRDLVQALIIFPLPVLLMALTWPLTSQRFIVSGFVGCSWSLYPSWQFLVFYVLSPVVVGIATATYAVMTFKRFREVAKTTETALSSNRAASLRSQRAKRRLYLMVLAVLVPYLPFIIVLAVFNVIQALPLLPFDYNAIHRTGVTLEHPIPWNTIVFTPARSIDQLMRNMAYIPIASAIPIFVFFGLTKDAINDYRRILLFLGGGRIWSSLHIEYDPNRAALRTGYNSSSVQSAALVTLPSSKASSSILVSKQFTSKSVSSTTMSNDTPFQHSSFAKATYLEDGFYEHAYNASASRHESSTTKYIPSAVHSLFPCRTRFDFPFPLRLPFTKRASPSHHSPTSQSRNSVRLQTWHSSEHILPLSAAHPICLPGEWCSFRNVVLNSHVAQQSSPFQGVPEQPLNLTRRPWS